MKKIHEVYKHGRGINCWFPVMQRDLLRMRLEAAINKPDSTNETFLILSPRRSSSEEILYRSKHEKVFRYAWHPQAKICMLPLTGKIPSNLHDCISSSNKHALNAS